MTRAQLLSFHKYPEGNGEAPGFDVGGRAPNNTDVIPTQYRRFTDMPFSGEIQGVSTHGHL